MDCASNIAFVDLQGFTVNKQFVLKEISFSIAPFSVRSTTTRTTKFHYIYKPPFDWKFIGESCKRSIIWITVFFLGLYWNTGCVPYSKIDETIDLLRSPNLVIYVKGTQKKQWLEGLLKKEKLVCHNIEDIGFDSRLCYSSASFERFNCAQHKHKLRNCALYNVSLLESWYIHNIKHGEP